MTLVDQVRNNSKILMSHVNTIGGRVLAANQFLDTFWNENAIPLSKGSPFQGDTASTQPSTCSTSCAFCLEYLQDAHHQ